MRHNFLKGTERIISNDEFRPQFGGVLIRDGYANVTDAHRALIIDLEFWGITDSEKELLNGYFFDKYILKEIKMNAKQNLEIQKGKILIYENGNLLKSIQLIDYKSAFDKVYLDLESVIPSKLDQIDCISFNAKYLYELERVYKDCNPKDNKGLKLSFLDKNKAIRIDSECGLFKGALMPLLLTW